HGQNGRPTPRRRRRPGMDHVQGGDHGEETGGVGKEGGRLTPAPDQRRRQGGTEDAGAVEGGLGQRDRLRQFLRFDQLGVERLVGGQVVGGGDAEQQGDQGDVPQLQAVEGHQQAEGGGQNEHGPLGVDQDPPAFEAVGGHAAEGHQDQRGHG